MATLVYSAGWSTCLSHIPLTLCLLFLLYFHCWCLHRTDISGLASSPPWRSIYLFSPLLTFARITSKFFVWLIGRPRYLPDCSFKDCSVFCEGCCSCTGAMGKFGTPLVYVVTLPSPKPTGESYLAYVSVCLIGQLISCMKLVVLTGYAAREKTEEKTTTTGSDL